MTTRPLLAISALALSATTLSAAAAYRYGLQHGLQRRSRRPPPLDDRPATMAVAHVATPPAAESISTPPSGAPSRLSLLTSMLLQDASLLVIALGLGLMALALTVSLALAAADAGVASLEDLPMLSSLMMVAIGMVVVGVLNALLQYSNWKRHAAPGELVLPPGHPPIPIETLKDLVELDEDGKPKQRVSKCPFGF